MKHDLQLPVSIWNLLPVWYYRNKGEVENIYICIYIYLYFYKVCSHLRKARVQNGVSGSFLGAVFEVVAGTKSEVWTNLS